MAPSHTNKQSTLLKKEQSLQTPGNKNSVVPILAKPYQHIYSYAIVFDNNLTLEADIIRAQRSIRKLGIFTFQKCI